MPLSRRRFINIIGIAGAAAILPVNTIAKNPESIYRWNGVVLGTDASIKLYSGNKKEAENLVQKCFAEILRLEKIFSIYQSESSISKLNKNGVIYSPPLEFTELVKQSKNFGELTNGAFDITIQPLWNLYKNSFAKSGSPPATTQIAEVKNLVNYHNIKVEKNKISFTEFGMQISMNGIAQGYITDKISRLLKQNGVRNMLVELGETHGIGEHIGGNSKKIRPWRIGIRNPDKDYEIIKSINIKDQAIATSGGYGMSFNIPEIHHIFNPATGRNSNHYKSVSVIAPNATTADALSTGLYNMKLPAARKTLRQLDSTNAIFVTHNGEVTEV